MATNGCRWHDIEMLLESRRCWYLACNSDDTPGIWYEFLSMPDCGGGGQSNSMTAVLGLRMSNALTIILRVMWLHWVTMSSSHRLTAG